MATGAKKTLREELDAFIDARDRLKAEVLAWWYRNLFPVLVCLFWLAFAAIMCIIQEN